MLKIPGISGYREPSLEGRIKTLTDEEREKIISLVSSLHFQWSNALDWLNPLEIEGLLKLEHIILKEIVAAFLERKKEEERSDEERQMLEEFKIAIENKWPIWENLFNGGINELSEKNKDLYIGMRELWWVID